MKAALEPSVSLEFDSYFFFLRKFHYIAMDREAQLKLTDQGERWWTGTTLDKFSGEVGEFFADQILGDDEPTHGVDEPTSTAASAGSACSMTPTWPPSPPPPHPAGRRAEPRAPRCRRSTAIRRMPSVPLAAAAGGRAPRPLPARRLHRPAAPSAAMPPPCLRQPRAAASRQGPGASTCAT